ncbi:MgtC/SapB family protein [bacterium]|nr:MgtC/SapB family protein [bacterium]
MNIIQMISRLSVAAVLGGLIGFEREKHGRPAGFRTHVLVSTGSALIMMVSLHLYDLFKVFNTSQYASGVDPSRIASMVIAGIGFVGAGTIIQTKGSVRGLTTAACLWMAAALGLAAGCGYYMPAIISGIISICSLVVLKRIGHFIKRDFYHHINIEMDDGINGLDNIKDILEEKGANILKVIFNKNNLNNEMTYGLSIRSQKELDESLINNLAQLSGVKRVTTR